MFEDERQLIVERWYRHIIWFQCAVILIALVGFLWIVNDPRPPGYMFVLNQRGERIANIPPIQGPNTLPIAFIKAQIAQFIHDSRTVFQSTSQEGIDQQKELLTNAYALTTDQAFKALDDYYHDGQHNPFDVGKKGWVEVALVRPPLQLTGANTYQVDWRETHHDKDGNSQTATIWRATVSVITAAPQPHNSLGFYLKTLDWAPEAP